jgi:hypothetical protein
MLPDLPRLAELVSKTHATQAVCQGTLRISIGRDYEQMLTAIRLHRIEFWTPGNKRDSYHDEQERPFRAAHQADITAAEKELADYYVRMFHAQQRAAETDARGAINAAVVRAFYHCGG